MRPHSRACRPHLPGGACFHTVTLPLFHTSMHARLHSVIIFLHSLAFSVTFVPPPPHAAYTLNNTIFPTGYVPPSTKYDAGNGPVCRTMIPTRAWTSIGYNHASTVPSALYPFHLSFIFSPTLLHFILLSFFLSCILFFTHFSLAVSFATCYFPVCRVLLSLSPFVISCRVSIFLSVVLLCIVSFIHFNLSYGGVSVTLVRSHFLSMCTYLSMYGYVAMYVCMCVSMCICIYVYMYIRIYVQMYVASVCLHIL